MPETRQVGGDGSPVTGSADGGLGGAGLLAWGRLCVAALEQRRTEIDALLEAELSRIELERAMGSPLERSSEGGLLP